MTTTATTASPSLKCAHPIHTKYQSDGCCHFGNSSPSSQAICLADYPCVACKATKTGRRAGLRRNAPGAATPSTGLAKNMTPFCTECGGWIFWLLGSAGTFGLFCINWDWGASATVVLRMKTKVVSQCNDIAQCGWYCSAQTKDLSTYRV